MGTRFEFVLPGGERERAAGEAAVQEVRHWHTRLSWFDHGSFLSHVNRRAAEGPVACDPEFFALLTLCRKVWSASNGAFDPTVAALMKASGFRGSPRDRDATARAIRDTGFDKVELNPSRRTVRFTRAGVEIDLGAIGKGWALDRAREVLTEAAVPSALLHGGTSSVAVIGAPPGGSGWRVRVGRRADAPVVELRDSGLGVSTPHGRMVTDGDAVWGHVLDPRTGRSARSAGLAAVVGASCAMTDAWSTALLVEGRRPEGMPADLTSMVAPPDEDPLAWRVEGPDPDQSPAPAIAAALTECHT
jgi:thiamine biosynthesis lipoprotein